MKVITLELLFSKHALDQACERGVSINEIKETIQKGAKFVQGENKIVADYRHIRVIFKKINDKLFIISVMIRQE